MSDTSMTRAQKIHHIVHFLIPILENDLEATLEARCEEHGTSGSGPNFAACLLCLVAVEVVSRLDRRQGVSHSDAIREVLGHVGVLAEDARYGQIAGPLYGLFRHGIVHTFVPTPHDQVIAVTAWSNCCPTWLGTPDGAAERLRLRDRHLNVRRVGDIKSFEVVPQLLYVDVRRLLADFARRLREGSTDGDEFEKNFDRWEAWTLEERYVTAAERAALSRNRSGVDV